MELPISPNPQQTPKPAPIAAHDAKPNMQDPDSAMVNTEDNSNQNQKAPHDYVRSSLKLWWALQKRAEDHIGESLTNRHLAVLLRIYLEDPPHRVKHIAEILNMSKPAVTRALDTLEENGLVRRKPDDADGRSVLLERTMKGTIFLTGMGEALISGLKEEKLLP